MHVMCRSNCTQCLQMPTKLFLQTNVNGQPAWIYDDKRREFYYNTYSSQMPDLNLSNAHVVARLDVSLVSRLLRI